MAELYGVAAEDVRRDPNTLMGSMVPEDRRRLEEAIASSMTTLAPMTWSGRIACAGGEVRWLETHTNVEREPDGKLLWWGQVQDVTERQKTERALAESEASRTKSEALYRAVIDALPVGVMVANQANEFVIFNPEQQRVAGGLADHQDGDITKAYGVFMADGVTPLPMQDSGVARGLRGETLEEEVVIRNPRLEGDVRIHVAWTPLRNPDGTVYAALGTSQDITTKRALEAELQARHEQLAASEEAKTELIQRLRHAIDELSNPILEVWDGVMVMPIIGVIDSRRAADMVHRLLAEVTRMQADFVIVDLTGVDIVDTKTADHLMKLMRKVEIVGSRCVLTGIRPAVAETLVDIGVDFGRVGTFRNLKHGLGEALRTARREKVGLWDSGADDEPAEEPQRRRRGA
jgi:rsbT co-antagonist protein RsbR